MSQKGKNQTGPDFQALEQTNAWLGGYHSMCREMLPAKFDFFLDEMICLRNIETIDCLERQGHHPHNL